MIQQINLYQDILQRQQRKSLLNQLPLIFACLLVVLVCFSLYQAWRLHTTKQQIDLNQQRLTAAESKVNALLSRIPAQSVDNNLAAEVQLWQKNLNDLSQTIQVLNIKNPDDSLGFSPYFHALANQAIADIWLTKIVITGQPKKLTLIGSTFKPGKIPQFFQNLHNEVIFQGQNFAQLSMSKHDNNTNQIDFKLNSSFEKAEEVKNAR